MLAESVLREARLQGDIFIETGTHRGDGVQLALNAGFKEVYTVDIAPFCYGWASHRFKMSRDKVHLFLGDSREFMQRMVRERKARAVFWLDAHWCGGDGEMDGRDVAFDTPAPLLEELAILASRRALRHDHILLIDDVRMMGTDVFPPLDEVLAAVHAVNPEYQITYADSEFPGDIIVATPPEPPEEGE